MKPLELRPMQGWPSGFWHTRPFDPLRLVIIRALPETPDTAFLRMFGRGNTFAKALRELASRTDNNWFIEPLKSLVVALGLDIPQTNLMQNSDADWQIEMEAIQRTYNEWKEEMLQQGLERGVQQGLERGVRQGLIASIETFCATCGIELTAERHQQLVGWDQAQLTQVQAALFATRQWPTDTP
ncbi:MAG: hypothetical protein AAGC55_02915 [Myxococcota bacterium]